MTNEPWADKEVQADAREGAKFKPVHPEDATTKAEMNRIRGMQEIKDFDTGPTNHTSNPSG
jgi:hypothetical protein